MAECLILVLILLVDMHFVGFVVGNPTWGTSASPIPPITDPPQIIIDSPNPTVYNNPVPLNITIIQPDSWVSEHNWTLPNGYVDNSDSVVVGQNTLRSIICVIDGQSFTLWNGTYFGPGVAYCLPRVTQFSALMNLDRGQHSLQVNVIAVSEYVTEGIIPFAEKEYIISTNQSTTFYQQNDLDSFGTITINAIKSSYSIWDSSTNLTSSPTTIIIQPSNSSLNPTTTSAVPEFSMILALTILTFIGLVAASIHRGSRFFRKEN